MDPQAYPKMLLVALAFSSGSGAALARTGRERDVAEGGLQQQRSVARGNSGGLHKALSNAVLRRHQFFMPSNSLCHRILYAIESCGPINRRVQLPDAENRTSGGVGVTGRNPRHSTRSPFALSRVPANCDDRLSLM